MYIYVYICICVSILQDWFGARSAPAEQDLISLYMYVHVHVHIHVSVYLHTYICTYIYMYTYIHINIYICMYTYMYAVRFDTRSSLARQDLIHLVCSCIYICMHMHIYIYMYVHVYACLQVGLARAVLSPGKILILDETLSGLDEQSAGVVLDNLRREFAGAGKTIIALTAFPQV